MIKNILTGSIQYGAKRKWEIDDVIYTYDQCLNITLSELSSLSGWTIAELKEVLLCKT